MELQELLAAHAGRLLADGRAGVVRNGYLPEREITGVKFKDGIEATQPGQVAA